MAWFADLAFDQASNSVACIVSGLLWCSLSFVGGLLFSDQSYLEYCDLS